MSSTDISPGTMVAGSPLPLQYLGSKTRICDWLLSSIETAFPRATSFVDLFSGTSIVGLTAATKGFRVLANDLQPYAYTVASALFDSEPARLGELSQEVQGLARNSTLLSGKRADARSLLRAEDNFFSNDTANWRDYQRFCETTPLSSGGDGAAFDWDLFVRYYSNTYFGVRQCLELDTIRQFASTLTEPRKTQLLAATISAMTYVVSSTTHLAQFLKPDSNERTVKLKRRRASSVISLVVRRLAALANCPYLGRGRATRGDFREVFKHIAPRSVIYADPPYFKEHYSRYYHVLDTFVLYDYPTLTQNPRLGGTTVGRYRSDRAVSDFGLRASVELAFSDLFRLAREADAPVALSYASTSLVEKAQIISLARAQGFAAKVLETSLMHSGQGQPRNRTVTEFLFLFS